MYLSRFCTVQPHQLVGFFFSYHLKPNFCEFSSAKLCHRSTRPISVQCKIPIENLILSNTSIKRNSKRMTCKCQGGSMVNARFNHSCCEPLCVGVIEATPGGIYFMHCRRNRNNFFIICDKNFTDCGIQKCSKKIVVPSVLADCRLVELFNIVTKMR